MRSEETEEAKRGQRKIACHFKKAEIYPVYDGHPSPIERF